MNDIKVYALNGKYITIDGYAKMNNITNRWARQLAQNKKLNVVRIGRHILIKLKNEKVN